MEKNLNNDKNFVKNIKSNITYLINNNLIFFSFIYLIFITINILLYLFFIQKYPEFVDLNKNLNLNQLTHAYSEIIKNIVHDKGFGTKMLKFDIDFYIARLPVIPFFISYIFLYSLNKLLRGDVISPNRHGGTQRSFSTPNRRRGTQRQL